MRSWDVPAVDGVSKMWVAWDEELHGYILNTTSPVGEEFETDAFPTVKALMKATWPVVDWPLALRTRGLIDALDHAPTYRLLDSPQDERELAMATALRSALSVP